MSYKKDIESFDGQYLKCIVTKHKSLFENNKYMANSGSLIIYQPPYSQVDRNYIYLGGEFLASGYGFATEALEQQAERIVNKYDSDIESLHNEDKSLSNRISNEVNELLEKMNEYVKVDGGFIENTNISINGKKLRTLDVILFGEEAKYENLEIISHTVYINGIKTKDNDIFLPIGSLIKSIKVQIEYKINDSGGIGMIQVKHNGLDNNELTNSSKEQVLIEYNDTGDGYIYNSEFNFGNISYIKTLENEVFVDRYFDDAISNFYISVKPTPEAAYKNYPSIETNLGVSIPSTGNIIRSNILKVVNSINVRPQYCMYWSYVHDYEAFSKNPILLNSFVDYDKTTVMIDILDAENLDSMYFAIPTDFALQKIYIVKDNIERYNWTGSVEMHPNVQVCAYNNGSQEKNKLIYCNIYKIYAENGFDISNGSLKIELTILYTKKKSVQNNNPDGEYYNDGEDRIQLSDANNMVIFPVFSSDFNRLINDEEFNNMYWISGSSLSSSESTTELENQLTILNQNGAKKTKSSIE